MSVRMGRVTALSSAALITAGASVLLAAPAHAHNTLVSSNPTAKSTVPAAPTYVELVFNEPVLALGTAVTVKGAGGDIADGKASVVDERVRQPLRAGVPAGKYTVSWRVTSSDGHPISDTFTFTAKTGSTPVPSDTAAVPATADAAASSGEETPWTQILIGGALGAAAGTGYVVYRRRRTKSSS